MAEKRIFLIFVDSFLNFCKANKNCDYSANFQFFCKISFLHGASICGFHICFDYHSNPTWNDWVMAKICIAGVFAPQFKTTKLFIILKTKLFRKTFFGRGHDPPPLWDYIQNFIDFKDWFWEQRKSLLHESSKVFPQKCTGASYKSNGDIFQIFY